MERRKLGGGGVDGRHLRSSRDSTSFGPVEIIFLYRRWRHFRVIPYEIVIVLAIDASFLSLFDAS